MKYEKKPDNPLLIKESGWTVDDYYELPEDGNQYEIYDGVLELKPSPTTTHQRLSQSIEILLVDSCGSEYIIMHAPVDVILSEKETRQPDILMIHRSREQIIQERAVVGPPDLVIEILSPSTAKKDRTKKKTSYARFGVPEYWIVDPLNGTIEQYVLGQEAGDYLLHEVYDGDDCVKSDKLPCVAFQVREALTIK